MDTRTLGLLVLLVACGKGKHDEPAPAPVTTAAAGSGSAQPAAPHTLVLADVPVAAGTPFELKDLKVMYPALVTDGRIRAASDTLELRVTVTPTAALGPEDRLTIVTTCRIHDVNLTFDEDRKSGGTIAAAKDGVIESLFLATPFADAPALCELALRHHTAKPGAADDQVTVVATACLHDRTLEAGRCTPSPFVAPTATGTGIVLGPRVETAYKSGVSQITGLFTMVEPLAPGEDLGSEWRCSDGTKTSTTKPGADSYSFWTPRAVPAGASAYGTLTSFLEGDVDPTRCQLDLVARGKAATPRVLGTYCVAKAGTVTAGACTPKL